LHDAVRKGHKEIAELLITAGANLNTKDRNNRTPLDWSINQKNRSITYVLRKHGAKTGKELPDISIHKAAWEGNIEAVKKHLAVGTDLDEIDMSQKTALHEAVRKGNKEIAELLITAGADLNAKDRNGSTPLKLAAAWGYEEISELLIAKGADLNAKDKNYRTPLDWSINQKNKSITDLLRKHGGKTGEELKAEGK
jgi:ankyrin repeat protein